MPMAISNLVCGSGTKGRHTSPSIRCFFLTHQTTTKIATNPNTPPATPSATASFCFQSVDCGPVGRVVGVLVTTAAKTVYGAVGEAGWGEVIGRGAIERVCQAKNEFWAIIGSWHVSLVFRSSRQSKPFESVETIRAYHSRLSECLIEHKHVPSGSLEDEGIGDRCVFDGGSNSVSGLPSKSLKHTWGSAWEMTRIGRLTHRARHSPQELHQHRLADWRH
jgi:hypothetical protein